MRTAYEKVLSQSLAAESLVFLQGLNVITLVDCTADMDKKAYDAATQGQSSIAV